MNKQNAITALELSAESYYPSGISSCKSDIYKAIEDPVTNTECFVKTEKDKLFIVFRGTDSKINRINNFCFAKKTIPYGNTHSNIRVHCGFLKSYSSVRKKIHKIINPGICKIILTGHSLGAALAVLCAVDLQYNFPQNDIEVYAFGCPRVGNAAFARSYNKRVFKTLRFNNGNDIVTKLPPVIFGFRHIGTEIHIGKARLPFCMSFKAHLPQNYYKNLWKET